MEEPPSLLLQRLLVLLLLLVSVSCLFVRGSAGSSSWITLFLPVVVLVS
jgi:hypothetical protein